MPLEIKHLATTTSERVKSVDFHSSEPWMLYALLNGEVKIWNYESKVIVKEIKVCDRPVRAAKFVERKNWIVTGSDDKMIRIFDCNTMKEIHVQEGHSDFIRSIAVHPKEPLILTCGDDHLIKLWNWEEQWACQQVFEGHSHYVMQIVFNPKDYSTFASASMDKTVKVWKLGTKASELTLDFHEKGVNCVDYLQSNNKSFLISGADDGVVRILDHQEQRCVQTLNGHTNNVTAVKFHEGLSAILSSSEDGSVKVWNTESFAMENSLNYELGRAWAVAFKEESGSSIFSLGCDEGSVVININRKDI